MHTPRQGQLALPGIPPAPPGRLRTAPPVRADDGPGGAPGPAEASPSRPEASSAPRPDLWLALYFPHLCLDLIHQAGEAVADPLVIIQEKGRQQWVHAANRRARQRGICPLMPLAAALPLCRELITLPRHLSAEQQALDALAGWGLQFTDHVHQPPGEPLILLEIGRSLRLFGGVEALRGRVLEALGPLGFQVRAGIAPCPSASRLLARWAPGTTVTDGDALLRLLREAPLETLEDDPKRQERLRGLGLRTLGDLLRLPREGLARRLGPELLRELDRLCGRVPDPLPRFNPPARFEHTRHLPFEVDRHAQLLLALESLLWMLAGWLRGRGLGVSRLRVALHHHRRVSTPLRVGLLSPSRDAEHLLEVCREVLERTVLEATVTALTVSAQDLSPLAHHQGQTLFTTGSEQRADLQQLLERLRARLGEDAVKGLACVADHRPERAWCFMKMGIGEGDPGSQVRPSTGVRPVWLLDPPMASPCPVTPVETDERIESGWWDDGDVRRDYVRASTPAGQGLWLYRDLRNPDGGWYLQGLFG
ncbi:MAG: DNA polymerase Y family protein [Chromatiaceae bacterium]|nr:MAG: DNA polymerase Y family protein [Chromatiaceae bacterium]